LASGVGVQPASRISFMPASWASGLLGRAFVAIILSLWLLWGRRWKLRCAIWKTGCPNTCAARRRARSVVVNSHGRPIVQVTAMGQTQAGESEADALSRLRAQSWVRAGDGGRISPVPHPTPAAAPREPLLSDLMLGDRG